jgi:hypothetical protein
MRLRPIHFVSDLDEALRFYEALGLRPELRSRSGHWVELQANGGELGLHDAAIAADGAGRQGLALNFLAEEPLEEVEQRLLDRERKLAARFRSDSPLSARSAWW